MLHLRERLLVIVAALLFLSACGYNDFDPIPPSESSENHGNAQQISIRTLQNWWVAGGTTCLTDVVIRGRVVSCDKAGNFYRSLFLQDASGGVELLLGVNNLYTEYALGSELSVRVKGLRLGCEAACYRLGYPDETLRQECVEIPTKTLADKYLFNIVSGPGESPESITIKALTPAHTGCLVKLFNLELDRSNGETWAVSERYSPSGYPVSRLVSAADATAHRVTVWTSGYANFADRTLPTERVNLTGIITGVYAGVYRLKIRSLEDVEVIPAN